MIRAFENDKRIATAVALKDGGILQVYPTKEKVVNEDTWKAMWSREGVTFKHEDKRAAQETERLSRAEKAARVRISYSCSLENPSDTPMQALVRKIYNQEGVPDSLRGYLIQSSIPYCNILRADPGIYVLLPENGHIVPVYFNRKNRDVWFGSKREKDEPTNGLKFYRKFGSTLRPIEVNNDIQKPGQKAVVICQGILQHRTYYANPVKQLRDAGFFVYTYNNRWHPSSEEIREIFRVVPRCQAIVWDIYNENISYFDLAKTDIWRCQQMNMKTWIAEHK